MKGFENYFISLHSIDAVANTLESIKIDREEDLKSYIFNIIKRRLEDEKAKIYKLRKEAGLVLSNIQDIQYNIPHEDTNRRQQSIKRISEHLLKTEKTVNDKINEGFTKVKGGILVQSLLDYAGDRYYLIAKMEFNSFLDRADWNKHIGLPLEKYVLKSCLVKFVPNPGIAEIRLYDSNPKIAAYWYGDFLALDEVRTDKYNTEITLKSLDTIFKNKLKKKFTSDYYKLKDRLWQYYISHVDRGFAYEEMKQEVVEEYIPINPQFKKDEIKKSLSDLVNKGKFDTVFPIDGTLFEEREELSIPVAQDIDLVLRDTINNLGNNICIYTDPAGNHFLMIGITNINNLPAFPKCN